ncbi:hypothetical protein ACQCN2_07220 [Brevibacillus ginsengisoli]|uniref:hypothetical protein n=1 Tax=Brevibacillus ginsengisoli TaxID=363854 RepID=UPI003CF30AE7
MAEQQPIFALQQAMFDLVEKQWSAVANPVVQTDAFADWIQTYLQSAAHLQDSLNKTSSTWLHSLNLPTREELAQTTETVIYLEERIEKLEDSIAQLTSQDARIVYLEHELSSLRSDYTALQQAFTSLSDKLTAMTEGSVTAQASTTTTTTKPRKTSRAKNNTTPSDSAN